MENVTIIFARNDHFYPFLVWVLSKSSKVLTYIQFLHFHEILVHVKDVLPLVLSEYYLGCYLRASRSLLFISQDDQLLHL